MGKRTLKELKKLTNKDYVELVAFAEKRLAILFSGRKIPQGRSGKDFVQEIITKVLEGVRNWNIESTPDFKKFLFSSVKSEISNFARSKLSSAEFDTDSDYEFWAALIDSENFHERKIQSELVDYVYEQICEIDENLGTLLLFELESCGATEIAKEMSLSVNEVYNMRKRLRRNGVKIWEEFMTKEALK